MKAKEIRDITQLLSLRKSNPFLEGVVLNNGDFNHFRWLLRRGGWTRETEMKYGVRYELDTEGYSNPIFIPYAPKKD